MKAVAVTPGKKDSAKLVDVDVPEPSEGEALIKVLNVGVDGTDFEINEGKYGQAPPGDDYLIIGHESLGIVEKPAGDFEKGDLVVATVRRPCPQDCINCHNGASDMCLTGDYTERGIMGIHGFMTEYYVENPQWLVKVPNELKEVGVLLEPLSIVEKGVAQINKIQKRMLWKPKTALVLGAGPIGLLASMLLRLKDIDVYTLDIVDKASPKANMLDEIEARYLDGRLVKLADLPAELGNIDIIFEATGDNSLALEGMSIIGINGIMCLTCVTGDDKILEICADCLNMQMVLGNKTIFGSVNANRGYFESGVEHMLEAEDKWPGLLSRMITRKVRIDDFQKALLREEDDIKTIIEI